MLIDKVEKKLQADTAAAIAKERGLGANLKQVGELEEWLELQSHLKNPVEAY